MKTLKKVLLFLLLAILVFASHVVISTGFFRTIENKFDGNIVKKINLPGAEDIVISRIDSFAIISSTKGRALPKVNFETGGLYFLDLKTNDFEPILLTENFKTQFAPHGISMIKVDSTFKVAAINHTEDSHSIEVFTLNGKTLTHEKTFEDVSMTSPNDVVWLDENSFYFSNDHKYETGIGRFMEDYVGIEISNVVFFDGKNYTEVADGVAFANGINIDKKRDLVFLASPRKFIVKVYQKNEDNSLTFIEDIDCGTGVDNIEFDTEGNIWIGSHPNLLHFAEYAKGNKETSPSEIIKINYKAKGDYTIEQVYMEDGTEMSASTVAVTFGDLILVGNVMDDNLIILQRN